MREGCCNLYLQLHVFRSPSIDVRRQGNEDGLLQLVLTTKYFPITIPLMLGGEGVRVVCCKLCLQQPYLNTLSLDIGGRRKRE